jgi:glutamate formiminotransferase/formiminotetrahydrofolate cyclodeaminase
LRGLLTLVGGKPMPTPLVECIPNFSEARRPEVVQAILDAIQSVPEVQILDHHSDMDHNRTVVTYVGSPAAVEEAAFQAIALAAQLIDLDHHTGEHPRIGATDVVPFVPISDVTMPDCVEMARRLGRRVGTELNIPVYLYEAAAARPDRQNLENIRRGQYEVLKEEIGTVPDRQPDFGPARLTGAGATVIGARALLVAFNVYLTTDEVAIAQKIAKAIRNSSGGLRYVKAMGILVEGRAQVSMNLTDFQQTPIARVVEMVRREAARYGVGVHHSELVGLAPQQSLVDAAVWYLQLDQFEPGQILESKLCTVLSARPATGTQPAGPDFLDELASGKPTPGGGSAAAHTGAAAAALVAMVARLTVGKKKYAAVEAQMWPLIEAAEAHRQALTQAVEQDAAAFEKYMEAARLPKDAPEQQTARAAALETAMLHAARVPLETARRAVAVIELAVQAATLGNVNAISDAGTAAALARAALTGAGLNVRTNTLNLADRAIADRLVGEIVDLEIQASAYEAQLKQTLRERGHLQLT